MLTSGRGGGIGLDVLIGEESLVARCEVSLVDCAEASTGFGLLGGFGRIGLGFFGSEIARR